MADGSDNEKDRRANADLSPVSSIVLI